MDNITGEEFRENTFVLRYWIELRNKELYNSEIENVAIKAHFLVASGISIILFGLCCIAFFSASLACIIHEACAADADSRWS